MTACLFCREIKEGLIFDQSACGLWVARWDGYPLADGHFEIVSRRHVGTTKELTTAELGTMMTYGEEVKKIAERLRAKKPDAWTIGINDGPEAGRTVPHLHMHYIPRWKGDVKNPRGGIRNIFDHNTY